jgi:hypothetical protein
VCSVNALDSINHRCYPKTHKKRFIILSPQPHLPKEALVLCIEIDSAIEKQIEALCAARNLTLESVVREALLDYLSEQADLVIAQTRLEDESDPAISMDEMRRRLGLEN